MSDVLAALGILAAVACSAAAILLPSGRLRSAAMLAALVLVPALVLGDQWHTHRIVDLRDHPSRLALLVAGAVAASLALALVFRRWPTLLPLAIVAALPFRVPLHAGGESANLLVPLYLVIAGGVLSAVARSWSWTRRLPATGPAGPATWVPRLLAAAVVLYGLQTLYSEDFSKGLQNVCFFFVPFSLAYVLLREIEWDRRLLTLVLWVVGLEAVAFVVVGSVEWMSRSLFWNDQVIRSNEFHTYFRVNSVFWDPNIYGRYLALVSVVAMSALVWARERRTLTLLTALIAIVWIGLFPTYSQSSFVALLAGLAVLAAFKWSLRWTLIAVGAFAVLGIAVVLLAGGASKLSPNRINVDTSGRANLVSGGVHLFAQRPLYGYGSGSFPKAYRKHVRSHKAPVSVSHTEPITVAAEQGLVGLVLYVGLVLTALWTMASRAPGPARIAVLAAFVALVVHTMAYAGFYEDPITWVLLAAGASLAAVESGAASSALGRPRL